jgi:hypothetical protein
MLSKKKLVDTYRINSGEPNEDTRRLRRQHLKLSVDEFGELEDVSAFPKRGRIRPRSGIKKEFGENLTPLSRFLEKSAGKKWDAVYSEISKRFSRKSVLGEHIYVHLWWWVERHSIMIDGIPHSAEYDLSPLFSNNHDSKFYVSPDGILKKAPLRQLENKTHKTQQIFQISDEAFLCQDKESLLWFRVTYKKQEYKKVTVPSLKWKRIYNEGKPQFVRENTLVEKDMPIYKEASFPSSLCLPAKKGFVIVACKSANKKDLKIISS